MGDSGEGFRVQVSVFRGEGEVGEGKKTRTKCGKRKNVECRILNVE
jgi:hypothetical protein